MPKPLLNVNDSYYREFRKTYTVLVVTYLHTSMSYIIILPIYYLIGMSIDNIVTIIPQQIVFIQYL